MANLTSSIYFTAVVRTADNTLTLQNTGNYSGVSVTTRWEVIPPAGGAALKATGTPATITLPKAIDGTVQQGGYKVKCIVNDGQDSSIESFLPLTLENIQPKLSVAENYTTPSFIYSDGQLYAQTGYITQSIIRAWSATRTGFSDAISYTGTSPVFNLVQNGSYYRSKYTVKEAVIVTYQKVGAAWATVVVLYTAQEDFSPKLFPAKEEMLGWIGAANDKECGCDDGNLSGCIYKLLTDFYCVGDTTQAWRQVLKLYRETHYKAAYRPAYDGQALTGVTYCTGVSVPLSIVTQPLGGTLVGGVIHLSVVAAGGKPPYTYQWYNSAAIVGATGASYTATAAGTYYVITTDADGNTVTSANADVTVPVVVGPSVESQPVTVISWQGQPAQLSVSAIGGTGGLSYQWQKQVGNNWEDVVVGTHVTQATGITANVLVLPQLNPSANSDSNSSTGYAANAEEGLYRLKIWDSAATPNVIYSNPAGVIVMDSVFTFTNSNTGDQTPQDNGGSGSTGIGFYTAGTDPDFLVATDCIGITTGALSQLVFTRNPNNTGVVVEMVLDFPADYNGRRLIIRQRNGEVKTTLPSGAALTFPAGGGQIDY